MNERISWGTLKKYKTALLSILILNFFLVAFLNRMIYYLDEYVLGFIKVLFVQPYVAGIFHFVLYIIFMAVFYLMYAGTILYPILNVRRELKTKNRKWRPRNKADIVR
jgi:hypothetical protein